jgi:thiol-disulfide isomerase/thioredoxin
LRLAQRLKLKNQTFTKKCTLHEVLNKKEYNKFINSLLLTYPDPIYKNKHLGITFQSLIDSSGFRIRPFTYDIRIGTEYKIRRRKYEKIGMELSIKKCISTLGDSLVIGGQQKKPTLINLWFIGCRGCIAEIPALNRLRDKYADKVNSLALSYDDKLDVKDFLKKRNSSFNKLLVILLMILE